MAWISPWASLGSVDEGWGSLGGRCGHHQTFPPPWEHPCWRSSSFTFGLVAGGGCLFASEELAGHSASSPKGPCSAFLATGWDNKGLFLPSAEKPLIRGRGTRLQPLAPLSWGQPRAAAEIWEVAGCASVLIWEALGRI